MSAAVMRVRLHLRAVRVTQAVVVRADGCMTVGRDRFVIWRSLAIGRCCYGPSYGSYGGVGSGHGSRPQFVGNVTRRLARQLVQDAPVITIQAASRRHRISWHLIMGLVTDGSRSHRQPSGGIFFRLVMSSIGSTASAGITQGLTPVGRELQRRQPPGVKPALNGMCSALGWLC